MPTLTSSETYQLTEFPNHAVNIPVLAAQIAAGGLSVALVGQPAATGSAVVITFTGTLLAADITLLNAIVAAHTGAAFGSTLVQVIDTTDSTTSGGAYLTKLTLNAGPLPAGTYLGTLDCEHFVDGYVANAYSDSLLSYNGAVVHEDAWNQPTSHVFSVAVPFTVIDGAMVILLLQYKNVGSVLVHCRRARLCLVKIG